MAYPIVVLGAGVAGLATALLLGRDGHDVVLLERDDVAVGDPEDSPSWRRKGVPHFSQPHALIPRARAELVSQFPDVYEALLAAGARDVDLRAKLPGQPGPDDAVLQYLAVRRPLIEWALRAAVLAEPRITVHPSLRATGLVIDGNEVTGVRADDVAIEASLVVDAMGRRTGAPAWMADAGLFEAPAVSSPCGVTYFCRYYRCRPGFAPPDGPWLLSPRGDLGYMAYASFPGDNGTFATVLAVPPGVPEWRAFREAPIYETAVATIPALASWVNPEGVDPITDVLPMAGLENRLRSYDPALSPRLVPVGDAFCHTDPVLAHGLAFALIHARELAAALREHDDPDDGLTAYRRATRPALRERYEFATALDEQRLRLWLGEAVDFTHPKGDYALFTMYAGAVAAMQDEDLFRMFVRRIGLLDSTAVLDESPELQAQVATAFGRVTATPRPPAGPGREEMVALVTAASRS